MASIGKRKIPIKKSQLNQAVLKKNNSLKNKNEYLQSQIKESESKLKDLESQEKVAFNRIKQFASI